MRNQVLPRQFVLSDGFQLFRSFQSYSVHRMKVRVITIYSRYISDIYE
jgi:hypothetical protein